MALTATTALAMVTVALAGAAPEAALDEAQRLFKALRFRAAIVQLEAGLEARGASAETKGHLLELLARAHIAEGNFPEAESAYVELLALWPQAALHPELSPSVRATFEAVKRRLFPAGHFLLRLVPAPPDLLRLEVVDPWNRASSVESLEREQGGPWRLHRLERRGMFWERSLAASGAPTYWYVQVRDAAGHTVAQLGDERTPFSRHGAALKAAASAQVDPGARSGRAVAERGSARSAAAWGSLGASVVAAGLGVLMEVDASRAMDRARAAEWAADATREHGLAVGQARLGRGLLVGAGLGATVSAALFAW